MQLQKPAIGKKFASVLLLSLATVVFSTTESGDLDVLMQFRDGLENPDLLKWPETGGLGLKGTLPQNLNKLSMPRNIGLQRNQLSGKLPSFSGLSNLQYAYLDYINFDSIPAHFFDGLDDLEVLALDHNNFNATTGWSFPKALQNSAQLTNLSCMSCNLMGSLPDFFGTMHSLTNLKLSGNILSDEIPRTFNGSSLQMFWLNGDQFTGPIDVAATMESLTVLWLHGNHFTGPIPDNIGNLTLLKYLNLNRNKLVGLIPSSLANMRLDTLDLNNNQFMGPIPMFKASNVTFASISFVKPVRGFFVPRK
ncbi:ribosome bioproteinsis protein NSA2-like protein [Hibiscus syriacus]|uniref:Ribosome bioproteinsis protein NSA2-like protein n=1 Tax=Hibiscus syriacus TaxID=106335 RepID=A0A6A2ZG73_HIBSY|nr:ribosome bioproteinsis protein NSA2-like protein [Hibiscus syriacus]